MVKATRCVVQISSPTLVELMLLAAFTPLLLASQQPRPSRRHKVLRPVRSNKLCGGTVQVERVLVYENPSAGPREAVPFSPGRDVWWQEEVLQQPATCPLEWVPAEHPLFLLYTSGSTGVHRALPRLRGSCIMLLG